MKIRVYKRIRSNSYDVVVRTSDWSQSDVNLFREFGEPEVDVGTDGHPRFARVMTQFPVVGRFGPEDRSDDRTAEELATEWKDGVVEKVRAAVVAQRQLVDGFTGEEVHMV